MARRASAERSQKAIPPDEKIEVSASLEAGEELPINSLW
ncbi:hypothetical protein ACP70R_014348 [Stipagrostis hirtigluma subsp. patula]